MKRTVVFILLALALWCPGAWGKFLTLAWAPNTEPDLAGYRVYASTTPGVYTYGQGSEACSSLSGTERCIVEITQTGRWYFVVTAYNTSSDESGPSNEVMKPVIVGNT